MRKMLLLLLVLVCIVLFAVPVFGAENVDRGFRGIPWGAKPPRDGDTGNNKWGLYWVYDHFSKKIYERDHENLSFGGAQVLFIEYSFQESLGFAKVEMAFHGLENYKLIRKACFENWGQPFSVDVDYIPLRSTELKAQKKDYEVLNRDKIEAWWKGKGISIILQHSSSGKSEGYLTINLDNYYDMSEIDDAKYPEYHEIREERRKMQEAMFPE